MALTVQSLSELDPDLVAQGMAQFAQLVQERYPEVELARGVFHDLVGYLGGGVNNAVIRTEINRVTNSNSLLAISEDPQLSDPELVDKVMSNHRISRHAGEAARGLITIVVTENVSVVVPAGEAYTANGVTFGVDAPYVAKPVGSQLLAATEVRLQDRGDGSYGFTIPATAVVVGVAGNIR